MFDHIKYLNADLMAGKTFEWLGEDNQENFNRHATDPVLKQRLETAGWFDKTITYQFNSQGFRNNEFVTHGDYFCSFGCSFTFGTAIQQQQRYADIVAVASNLQSYNFGVQGGNDSASFRFALTWLDKLSPKFVVYQNTFPQRFEVIDNDIAIPYGIHVALGGNVPNDSGKIYKQIIGTEANEQIRAIKNQLAMRELCRSKNIKLIEISYIDFLKTHDNNARDLHHPGAIANQSVAELILNQL
jgi:hypothetical protein